MKTRLKTKTFRQYLSNVRQQIRQTIPANTIKKTVKYPISENISKHLEFRDLGVTKTYFNKKTHVEGHTSELVRFVGGSNKRKSQAANSSIFVFQLLCLGSRPLQTVGYFLGISIAGRECLCVSGKMALWLGDVDIIILVPMFYLKLCNHTYTNIYVL